MRCELIETWSQTKILTPSFHNFEKYSYFVFHKINQNFTISSCSHQKFYSVFNYFFILEYEFFFQNLFQIC
jgi:hypothetical protein